MYYKFYDIKGNVEWLNTSSETFISFSFHFINIYAHEYLSARKINTNNNIFLERKQNNFKNCCSTKGSCLGPVGSKDTL